MTFQNPINESAYEDAIISIFKDLGYRHVYGPSLKSRDFYSPLYEEELTSALHRINPNLPDVAIKEALFKLKNFENCKMVLPFTTQRKTNQKIRLFI